MGTTMSLRKRVGGHPSQHPSPSQILWGQEKSSLLGELQFFSYSSRKCGFLISNHLEILT